MTSYGDEYRAVVAELRAALALRDDEASIAAEAARLVRGKRAEQYGSPVENMARIGAVWGALLGVGPIPARMVALLMVGLKLARETGPETKRDNLVDACGYLLIAEQCGEDE